MKAPASKNELDALLDNIFVSPELYLQSYDITRNTMTFTPMTAETYRSTSFLDERIHQAQPVDARVDLNSFIDTFENVRPTPRPLGFIFHTGFCCSTLLARCIQELENTLVLKEPVPLRTLGAVCCSQVFRKRGVAGTAVGSPDIDVPRKCRGQGELVDEFRVGIGEF